MSPSPFRVRPASPADASKIAEMANALNVQEGKSPDVFTPMKVLEDLFGGGAVISVVVAELGSEIVGYALFEGCYNTDHGSRDLFLDDLFVVEPMRGRGIGRALLAQVCREAVARSARTVVWAVRGSNTKARAFYRMVGARDEDLRLLTLDGDALEAMSQC
jgi:ribosomal protein S18 acetylase RimI-like enzyme